MSDDSTLRMAAELQLKFSFYLTGLTFGILALSVQTSTFDIPLAAQCAEIGGWVLMLVSGVAGLMRLEVLPHIHALGAHEDRARARAHDLYIKRAEGLRTVRVTREDRDYPVDDLIRTEESDADVHGGWEWLHVRGKGS